MRHWAPPHSASVSPQAQGLKEGGGCPGAGTRGRGEGRRARGVARGGPRVRGGGGATLRRLSPRLPAEPRRREAAPRGARRPRRRRRNPAAARPTFCAGCRGRPRRAPAPAAAPACPARPGPGRGSHDPGRARLGARQGLQGPLSRAASPSSLFLRAASPHPTSASPTLAASISSSSGGAWRASRIGRMYPQGRHPVSGACGEGVPGVLELRP